ncbi:MAG: IS200/IS605 family transposase [Bacteroidota bacterium]
MANTYTQIYIQIIFAVQFREYCIPKNHKEELHKYITGIVRNQDQKLIAINSMPDHIHIFIGQKPSISLSNLVRDIKSMSSTFVNEKKWFRGKFRWQEGFGAFSYSHSHIDRVVKYIQEQEKHHLRRSFREEYIQLLKSFTIDYNEKYLFNWNSSNTV